ncbi:MAG: hypothetical protein ACR2H1_00145, partial [Limisphaerales bacterium]
MKIFFSWRALFGLGLLAFFAIAQKVPNVSIGKGFSLPYFQGTNLVAIFTGEKADPIPGGEIWVNHFELKKLNEKNRDQVDMIVQAPRCFLNTDSKIAYSPGLLKVLSEINHFSIEGKGFIWTPTKTNINLVISNEVHAIIQTTTNLLNSTNSSLDVFSDHFEFDSETKTNAEKRLATFSGRVRIEDNEMRLTCGLLT